MKMLGKEELQLVNIHIGLSIRLGRLKQNLSQLEFANSIDTNNTTIGRVERAEHYSAWDKVFLMSQYLQLDFNSLFVLKTKSELLKLVEDCLGLDNKLTKEKSDYYVQLRKRIDSLCKLISSKK
jgi:transcriptional regulator with XRE-family HTH domain